MAQELRISDSPKVTQTLLPRMRENGKSLLGTYRALSEAIHRKEYIPPAAEWLTDNFHIIEDQLREIKEDLPPSYYKELPKIALGELAGYPRIYAISLALIAHTDSELQTETIRRFVMAFQRVAPLSIGELWALAITLRLTLVENLRRVAVRILVDHEKRTLANQIADDIFDGALEKSKFQGLIQKISPADGADFQNESSYFAQLAKRFRDQEPEIWPALEFLEQTLRQKNFSTEQAVHLSHQSQAANQVTVANIITSMRLISSLNWRDFFESLSTVDRLLETDPVYKKMDFLTRDRYRHVIENIGKKTKYSEIQIAEGVLNLTRSNEDQNEKRSHVGYYLIDTGIQETAKLFKYKVGSFFDLTHSYKNLTYFGLLALFSLLAVYWPLHYLHDFGITTAWSLVFGLLILIPVSDVALSFTNMFLTRIIPPKNLPKLDLSKGIPADAKTIIVIPCMLADLQVIKELIEKLEVHYLGNSDPQLSFALLTDFTDAISESMPLDETYIDEAVRGIQRLNQKHAAKGSERFFLFHRRRQWNASENTFMGWERKRGKLHEFNLLLRGNQNTSFNVMTTDASGLQKTRFVITLDADSQLPRDMAKKLVGTILHPLNKPVFNSELGRVTEGYGILQPRIGISLESSARSYFSKIFSGYIGIDPYTTAVSEVYQDLFHEGSFTGKGLYDIDAFEASLQGRVPENSILSHDLFEGIHARTALMSDIELLDDYPQTYRTFFTRLHRWIRGDWQTAPWIFAFVKNEKNQSCRNRLPLISRWKIFDNLRRSLVAPLTFLWLMFALIVLPGSALCWTAYIISLIALPAVAQSLLGILVFRRDGHFMRISEAAVQMKFNILQLLFHITFMAHLAVIQVDAICRVLNRMLISKKKLLEWATSAQVETETAKKTQIFWQTAWPTEILLLGFVILIFIERPYTLVAFSPLFLLWMCYPYVADFISHRLAKKMISLEASDILLLRQIARRTWRYFEVFVGATDNWLPPDNHQIAPSEVTAHRTSPTNIGLYMLSLMSAQDFGYITTSGFIRRLKLTLATMGKMELHQGHFLNWYDTTTLAPLYPKYVSTVDSGNLAGYLITLRESCLEIEKNCVINKYILQGIEDNLLIFETELQPTTEWTEDLKLAMNALKINLVEPKINSFSCWLIVLNKLKVGLTDIKQKIKKPSGNELWLLSNLEIVTEVISDIEMFTICKHQNLQNAPKILSAREKILIEDLDLNVSFLDLQKKYSVALRELGSTGDASSTILRDKIQSCFDSISALLQEAEIAAQFTDQKFNEMNFNFLLQKEREVFCIGYNVSDSRFDSGLYDLLGSESRLASFVAIAKGDVEQEHWFRLGRQLVPTTSGRALVSWTASMFEYLMPLLVLRDYENTLLHETLESVVGRQISYGNENNVPWGISEAGYNARDLQLNYQYGPFGIPGLGLKRGLSHDLVISPYSTLLASQVNPQAALLNLKRLIKNNLLTPYGFYEAVDYTRERLPENEEFAVIKSFMAHHQGMSLVAINNVIHNKIVQNRFHRDPRMRATRLLLQERVPQQVTLAPPKAAEVEIETRVQPAPQMLVRHYTNPERPTPRIHLLSNQHYSLMISTAGGGYSKCDNFAVTRWKEDGTRDNFGSFIFIKDVAEKNIWSTTHLPLAVLPEAYKVSFSEDKVEFRRRDEDIATYTQIMVAAKDDVEIRHVTLTNHSEEDRVLELTSYLEPVLNLINNDLDHPTFSKLFIQTEFLASKNALVARRRRRSEHDPEIFGLHVAVTDAEIISEVQYETDRSKFIGRGRTLLNSLAISENLDLSNSIGSTIDPIFSLRLRVKVPAHASVQVAFTTGLTTSREKALELADRYHDIHAFDRESKFVWMQSQVEMRHLNIDSQTAYLYQLLAERILYSESTLRPPAHMRAANTQKQSNLWVNGIGGDLPIVAVRISDLKDIAAIRKLLRCHEYLRLKGLVYDFVIINEHAASYHQELQDEIMHQIRSTGSQNWMNKNGGIFILRRDITPEKDIAHIQAIARVSLAANEPLSEQVSRKPIDDKYPALGEYAPAKKQDAALIPAAIELDFFNGFGGFSKDGKEYVTILKKSLWTPAPWINVVGNELGFGFQISEAGSGFTWAINSQANRLTPWSNDPVSDPSGEIIYLRDDETGEFWTPTPLPIRGPEQYTIRHGQGYSSFEHSAHGFEHELKVFVPKKDPIKISLLKLKNKTSRRRKISVISYTEWVLGTRREKTGSFLICDLDKDTQAIFARNPHDNEFSNQISFADMSQTNRTFTCSRKEFLGRNGNYANPEALKRSGLSQKRGTGQDPCAVLQTSIEIKPGEEFEVAILLGQCENTELARQLTLRYRDLKVVKNAFLEATAFWDQLTNVIQVKTPEPAMNYLMNKWLMYQSLSCRYWSRTAFYQSGGAYGFRDQLQDCMAFVYATPKIAREHILRASERQFKEGDVQHWWHPPTGRGIRTRMSDDLLWLPYVVSFYIKATGDHSILNEITPFLEAPLLKPGEEDSYTEPAVSSESSSVFDHCVRAINRSLALGEHGLPLIGTGDWNDGMNRIGPLERGESVWLGWFLYKVLADFLPLCDRPDQSENKQIYKNHMEKLKTSIEAHAWDGKWYKRAFYDDGTPVGSAENDECRIDSISQTWSVLSGAGDTDRSQRAMEKVNEHLIKKDANLVLLLTPPFDKNPKDPGYIKGYVPGVRENGGQYTHAGIWVIMAYAKLGQGNKAAEIFNMMNPILHSQSSKAADKYKIEPYVLAGDVYAVEPHEGRGGWSWYTGSASWYYRAGLESILGFTLRANKLAMSPCIPKHWKSYEVDYVFGKTKYHIVVKNPEGLSTGLTRIELNSELVLQNEIDLIDDGKNYEVVVTLHS